MKNSINIVVYDIPGIPCVTLNISRSDRLNTDGAFEDSVEVNCDEGYYPPGHNDPFTVTCQSDQTWNVSFSECLRKCTICIQLSSHGISLRLQCIVTCKGDGRDYLVYTVISYY